MWAACGVMKTSWKRSETLNHDEHEEYLTWVGGEFDPEAFDLEEVNARLRRMGRGRSTGALDPWSMMRMNLWG